MEAIGQFHSQGVPQHSLNIAKRTVQNIHDLTSRPELDTGDDK
jgi:hypothetical protein